jgi:hypothetical protein
MDTDDLTPMAYNVIIRAVGILDVLSIQIGASASDKKTEDGFLHGVTVFLRKILKSPRAYVDDWNYLEEVDVKIFRNEVAALLVDVEKVLAIPYAQRGAPTFKSVYQRERKKGT